MKLSHVFRTTILATTLAFGLTGYVQASTAKQQVEQGVQAYEQKDYATALKFWQPLAEQGNAAAQNNLGVMYENGRGVAQDYQQAVYWYQKAAQQGEAKAQNNLGAMYSIGWGVAQDDQQAFYWLEKAAQQGNVDAKFSLGMRYWFGRGGAKSVEQATYWLNIAAEHGDRNMKERVAEMYLVLIKDGKQAVYWYERLAQQGDAEAQHKLGWIYYFREDVIKKDIKKARSLWQQACKQGYKESCSILEGTKPSKKAK